VAADHDRIGPFEACTSRSRQGCVEPRNRGDLPPHRRPDPARSIDASGCGTDLLDRGPDILEGSWLEGEHRHLAGKTSNGALHFAVGNSADIA
jgi:hypothetical protein